MQATFTVMMTVSKSAAAPALPDSAAGDLAGTHYTVLATAEILGKLVRIFEIWKCVEFFELIL